MARLIHTGPDGRLASTTREEIAAIVADASRARRVVVHFHGGLVSERSGFAIAERLDPIYEAAGALPIFFVWRSGLLEIITGNLRQIFAEEIFQRLLRSVLRYAVGKIRDAGGGRGLGGIEPAPGSEADVELAGRAGGREPYGGVTAEPDVPEVDERERAAFESTLARDGGVRAALGAVLGPSGDRGARAAGGGEEPVATLMDDDVLAGLRAGQAAEGDRSGLVSTALLARKCSAALVRVIGRMRSGAGHGVYSTVVEEVLREFYLGGAGAAVWAAMKAETAETFAASGPDRGGRVFLDLLAEALDGRTQLSLVGHSTGAVFIDYFLTELGALGHGPTVRNVVFLAPAATTAHFAEVLASHRATFDRFRMFTMTDEAERADRLLGAFYPRSLLYLVSGLLERDEQGDSRCVPLVGLARYLDRDGDSTPEDVRVVNDFLREPGMDRFVLSPTAASASAGLRAAACRHGDFDDDHEVLASVGRLIGGGDA